jgi:outer membrane protein TolC
MLTTIYLGMVLAFAADADAEPAEKPDAKTQERIKKLLTERRDTLKKAVDARKEEFEAGRITLDEMLGVAKKFLQAELDLATKPAERLAAYEEFLKVAKESEEILKTKYEAGRASQVDYFLAKAARLEAEAGWLKAGGKDEKKKDK